MKRKPKITRLQSYTKTSIRHEKKKKKKKIDFTINEKKRMKIMQRKKKICELHRFRIYKCFSSTTLNDIHNINVTSTT